MNKTIKVFIASSEELKEERLELLSIEKRINKNLEQHGVKIEIIEWEYLDPEMGLTRKQEDYNKELRSCDICCVICWQKFGKYTAEEFKIAHEAKVNGDPLHKIYIFFKEPGEYTDELKAFKKGIEKDYGHFPSCFETVDAFRFALYDILNREALKWIKSGPSDNAEAQTESEDDDVQFPDSETASQVEAYTVRNSKIEVNGEILGDFSSMPFAKNNARYQLIRQEVDLLEQILPAFQEAVSQQASNETIHKKYQELQNDLANKKNLLHSMECTLLKTYCGLIQFLTEHNSLRVKKALKLFNQGNETAVNNTLDSEQLGQDLDRYVKQLNEARKSLSDAIGEHLLKIKVIEARKEQNWAAECVALYRKATEMARNNTPEAEFAKLITEFAIFLQTNGQFDSTVKNAWYNESEKLHMEAQPIWKSLSDKDPEQFLNQRAYSLYKYIILLKKLKKTDTVEKLYTEVLELYSKLAEENPNYREKLAEVHGNRGLFLKRQKQYEQAESEYLEAIDICRQATENFGLTFDRELARIFHFLGILYKDTIQKGIGSLEKSLEALNESFQIYSKLAENDPDKYQHLMASVLRTKAKAYNTVKDYSEAKKVNGEAVAVFLNILQRQTFQAKTQRKCCMALSEQALYAVRAGFYKEAEECARESMKWETQCGLFSEKRAAPMKNLGYALLFQGHTKEAKEWLFSAAQKTKDNGQLWNGTIIEELDRFKNEELVPQDKYDVIDALVAELRTTSANSEK